MTRITMIHWNAEEAQSRAKPLREADFKVRVAKIATGGDLPRLLESTPDVFLIDLTRLPTQGRDVGVWLRQRKVTRHVPLVFVGGDDEKVARFRKTLPDAVFTPWRGVRGAIRKAIQTQPERPVVGGAMAGYSGTPLVKKLGIKPDSVLTLLNAPDTFERTLGTLPHNVTVRRQARGQADSVILFVNKRTELERRFASASRALAVGGGIWIAWPKKASGVITDVTESVVRNFGLSRAFVDHKIAAIDETWSGLRFVRRKKEKGKRQDLNEWPTIG